MTVSGTLLSESDQEEAATRRVLEWVPDDNPTWKPCRAPLFGSCARSPSGTFPSARRTEGACRLACVRGRDHRLLHEFHREGER